MNYFCMGSRPSGARCLGMKMFQGAALALVLAMALPARAADERAVKSRVAPVYPEIAKRMKIGGMVRLEATVDADGRVTGVKAVSGNRMLAEAAENAVKQWKFVPASGEANVNVEVNFAVGQ
jgi:TonB family protein